MKIKLITILFLFVIPLYASGGYDNGTATGKGQLELDLTWNPFDLIEYGQTYVVISLGITSRFDLHSYYAHQTNDQDNYYYGLFYQFIDNKYIDLATAVGRRQYTKSNTEDLFFPQFLFSIYTVKDMIIGGALVNIKRKTISGYNNKGIAFDIAISIPIINVINAPKCIDDLRLTIGLFNPGIFEPDHGDFLPTYSIDITFKKMWEK